MKKKFALHYKVGEKVHWLAIQCEVQPSQKELKVALNDITLPIIDIKEISDSEYAKFIKSSYDEQKQIVQKLFYSDINITVIDLSKTGGGTTERSY